MLKSILWLSALTFSLSVTSVVDITGTWELEVETDGGSGTATFEFVQKGQTLSGTYKGMLGTAALSGTVKGKAIDFSFSSSGFEITYSGTIEGSSMKGTCEYGGQASGTFSGKKAEQ